MWIDDDGNDLDYSPDREARIGAFIDEAMVIVGEHLATHTHGARMSATTPRLDGCPQACGNTELPWFVEAVPGAVRASYTCADCGERWTTDWAVETVRFPRSEATFERAFAIESGQKSGPESAATDAGPDRLTRSRS